MQKCQEVPVIRETPRQTHPGTSPGAPPTGQGSTCIDVTSFWARSSRFNVNRGAGAGVGVEKHHLTVPCPLTAPGTMPTT